MGTIKAVFSFLAAFLGGRNAAAKRANTPDMKANAQAKQDAAIKDAVRTSAKKRNLEQIRKDLAE